MFGFWMGQIDKHTRSLFAGSAGGGGTAKHVNGFPSGGSAIEGPCGLHTDLGPAVEGPPPCCA